MAATIRIHHRHLLLLLSPQADIHFTIPRRVEGWVDLGNTGRVWSPFPRLYVAVAVMINITGRSLSHGSHACQVVTCTDNKLPKAVARQHGNQESNTQPQSCESTIWHQLAHKNMQNAHIKSRPAVICMNWSHILTKLYTVVHNSYRKVVINFHLYPRKDCSNAV